MIKDEGKNAKAHFVIDIDTANSFRKAVRHRWGNDAWGKMQEEHKKALDERAKKLYDYFELI